MPRAQHRGGRLDHRPRADPALWCAASMAWWSFPARCAATNVGEWLAPSTFMACCYIRAMLYMSNVPSELDGAGLGNGCTVRRSDSRYTVGL